MTCTLILIGDQPDNRLQPEYAPAAAPGVTVVASCPHCEHATKVVVSASAASESGFVVTHCTELPDKPAETYVLQFADQAAALAWIEQSPGRFVGKTLVLLNAGC